MLHYKAALNFCCWWWWWWWQWQFMDDVCVGVESDARHVAVTVWGLWWLCWCGVWCSARGCDGVGSVMSVSVWSLMLGTWLWRCGVCDVCVVVVSHAHDTLAGNSRWNPALEYSAGLARVAVLVFSASFQRENMANDEDTIYYYKNNDV